MKVNREYAVDYEKMGARIARIRRERGMSQENLAESSGITPTNLSHIERGKTKGSIETIVAIANALGVTPNDFLCDSLRSDVPELRNTLLEHLEDCSLEELRMLSDLADVIKKHWKTQ